MDSKPEPRSCPNCDGEEWNVYDDSPAEYTNEPAIRCDNCGQIGHGGGFGDDVWMWGWE